MRIYKTQKILFPVIYIYEIRYFYFYILIINEKEKIAVRKLWESFRALPIPVLNY